MESRLLCRRLLKYRKSEKRKKTIYQIGGSRYFRASLPIFHTVSIVKANKEAEEAWLKLSPAEKQKFLEPHEPTIKIDEVDITKIERITPEISAAVKTRMPAKLERKFVKK